MNRLVITLMVVILALAGCASTTKLASWTNPDRAGAKVRSVFIIGTAREELTRRLFEDELARQLAVAGVRGITSYRHLSLQQLDDKGATEAKVKALGAESVIIAKVVGERTETVVSPGRTYVAGGSPFYSDYRPGHDRDHWHDYYRSSYAVISQPPTVTNYQVVTVETNLYGADAGMIWSMRSETETIAGRKMDTTIKEFVEVVVEDLSANGLI